MLDLMVERSYFSNRTIVSAAVIATAAFALAHAGALAAFDPYQPGANGYDFSYIQCGDAAPTTTFGIVGVNAGYPFTYYNNCLGTQFAAAAGTGDAALYVNTGYDPSYTAIDGRHTTQACADQGATISGTAAQQAAWAVGCSEAERDLTYASSESASSPTMWWLDVETANSWSTINLSLNQYTMQGLIDRLRATTSTPVGIYSTPVQWQSIAGEFHPAVDADWLATGQGNQKRASKNCSASGFTGAPVWLVQYVTTFDHDYAC